MTEVYITGSAGDTFWQCCGAGAGGAEIIWDLKPKLNF